jgi:hypothetical protein
MKHLLYLLFFLPFFGMGQNNLGSANDQDRIAIDVLVPPQVEDIPDQAQALLENKLMEVAVKNGLGGSGPSPRFVLTAKMTVLTKDVTPTVPPMEAYTFQIYLYIVDCVDQIVVSTTTISSKGAGNNKNKAYLQGLRGINTSNSELERFMKTGKQKIIEYYNSRCDFVLAKAKSLAAQNQFQAAIATLSGIPEVCKDCYMKSLEQIAPIYKDYIDHDCQVFMNMAQSIWASNPTAAGAADAGAVLCLIDPDSKCYGDTKGLISKMEQKVQKDEIRDWKFMERVWGDNVALEKLRIKAYRDIGVAFGNNQQPTYNNILWVFRR